MLYFKDELEYWSCFDQLIKIVFDAILLYIVILNTNCHNISINSEFIKI